MEFGGPAIIDVRAAELLSLVSTTISLILALCEDAARTEGS
jgi:hypothetical protein